MGRTEEYRRYMNSREWKEHRRLVIHRAKGICELCHSATVDDVHHVRYPKRFADDHPDNLLALCHVCHEKQHGIRGETMTEQMMQKAQQVEFVFQGKGKTYEFSFLMIPDGAGNVYPWIPIKEVERRLSQEESSAHDHLKQELSPEGRILDARAATMLRQDLRMVSEDGQPWVRASGVFQVLCRMDGPVCEAFRDQLGTWMESEVVKSANSIKTGGFAQGLSDASTLQGNGIALLKSLNQQFAATLVTLEDHQQIIAAGHHEIASVKNDQT